jgi:tetratricopeptide (TPR) repeat protein
MSGPSGPSTWSEAKTIGNAEYLSGNMQKAIEMYALAIELGINASEKVPDNEHATILCNRAQCHLKLNANAAAISDCSAALALSPGHLKSLFRRAAALEASGKHRDALADYREVLKQQPNLADANAGERRCLAALGEPAPAPKGAASKTSNAPLQLSEEERKLFTEAQQRTKDVFRQKLRAQEQLKVSLQEKKRAELTLSQLQPLPADTPDKIRTFRGIGRMFVRTPRDDIINELTSSYSKYEQRHKVCVATLEYLTKQEKEADDALVELTNGLTRSRSRS